MNTALKTFRVRMSETTSYFIDVNARDEEEAVEIAEHMHDCTGLEGFQFDADSDVGGTDGSEAEQLAEQGASR